MILFTSDLDRTLIYSNNMLEKYPVEGDCLPIEYKGDRIISNMTMRAIELLKEIDDKHLFIPVTTRAIYQYERIDLFQQDIQPKYAITSNGGTIFVNGKKDVEWDQINRNRIAETAVSNEDMRKVFAEIEHKQWMLKEFYIDDLFFMFHVDQTKMPMDEWQAFEENLYRIGWRAFLQGRKLYLLPIQLEKAAAINYIKQDLAVDFHVAAGDSLMDYAMLKEADIGYSPFHGELYQQYREDPYIRWIDRYGASSAEDILVKILQLKVKARQS